MREYIAMTADMVKPEPERIEPDIIHDAPKQTLKLGDLAVCRLGKSEPLIIARIYDGRSMITKKTADAPGERR